MVLKVDNIHAYYGVSHILHGVTIQIKRGEIVGLIGNNGVGKTTLLKSIMGLTRVRSGHINFQDQDLLHLPPFKISRLGISLIPENRDIFPDLTVYENLLLGMTNSRRKRKVIGDKIHDYFPILKARLNQKGGTLSGGEQQMLAIARGLVGEPELILVDEFSEGLQPLVIRNIVGILREVQKEGKTILMVEQDARLALHLSERIYIMEKGEISYHGLPEELLSNAKILKDHLAI
ncbi:MAG TPA: ABC transporter ATP-binding protein [Desulfobacterales bacterium]|nr:ABC transporter ATP-binding protein [Desulfobacterales bacterium]